MADTTTHRSQEAQSAPEKVSEKAQEAAGQARERAEQVADEARGRVRAQLDERSTQAGERVRSTAGDLRSVADSLREQGKEQPAMLAEQVAGRAERMGGYLERSDADRLMWDIEGYARRQPWVVGLGAAALGFAAARFLKASSAQRYEAQQSGRANLPARSLGPPPLPAPAVPPAGV
jgi:hypothetical protein